MFCGVYSLPLDFPTSVMNLHNHSHTVSLFSKTSSGHLYSGNRLFLSDRYVSNVRLVYSLFFSMFKGHVPPFILFSSTSSISNAKRSSAQTYTLPDVFTGSTICPLFDAMEKSLHSLQGHQPNNPKQKSPLFSFIKLLAIGFDVRINDLLTTTSRLMVHGCHVHL